MSGIAGFAVIIGIIAGIGKDIELLVSSSKKERRAPRTRR
jgi:hypothetical protein